MSKQRINPTIKLFGDKEDAYFSCDTRFPSLHLPIGCRSTGKQG